MAHYTNDPEYDQNTTAEDNAMSAAEDLSECDARIVKALLSAHTKVVVAIKLLDGHTLHDGHEYGCDELLANLEAAMEDFGMTKFSGETK